MYVTIDRLDAVFREIRRDSSVLIFVATDVDALCSCRILTVRYLVPPRQSIHCASRPFSNLNVLHTKQSLYPDIRTYPDTMN